MRKRKRRDGENIQSIKESNFNLKNITQLTSSDIWKNWGTRRREGGKIKQEKKIVLI